MKKLMSNKILIALLLLALFGFYKIYYNHNVEIRLEEEAEELAWKELGSTKDNPWIIEVNQYGSPEFADSFWFNASDGSELIVSAHRGTKNGDKIASIPTYIRINGKLYKYSETLKSDKLHQKTEKSGYYDQLGGKILNTCYSEEDEGYEEGLMHNFGYLPVN